MPSKALAPAGFLTFVLLIASAAADRQFLQSLRELTELVMKLLT
jgi:hypothetical protein